MYFLLNIHGYSSLCDSLLDQRVYPFQHLKKQVGFQVTLAGNDMCAFSGFFIGGWICVQPRHVESNGNVRVSKLVGIPKWAAEIGRCVCIFTYVLKVHRIYIYICIYIYMFDGTILFVYMSQGCAFRIFLLPESQ